MYEDNDQYLRSYERNRKRKTKKNRQMIAIVVLAAVVVVLVGLLFYFVVLKPGRHETLPSVDTTESGDPSDPSYEPETPAFSGDYAEVLKDAHRLAMMYDYQGAADLIKSRVPDYEAHTELRDTVASYMAKKSKLVKWRDNTKMTTMLATNCMKMY